jgi:hypothetical protein
MKCAHRRCRARIVLCRLHAIRGGIHHLAQDRRFALIPTHRIVRCTLNLHCLHAARIYV